MKLLVSGFLLASVTGAAAQSWTERAVTELQTALEMACEGRQACLAQIAELGVFLWRHRNEADIQARAVRCVAQTAVARGYVWSPSKLLEDLTPETVTAVGLDLCQCVVPKLLEPQVCEALK